MVGNADSTKIINSSIENLNINFTTSPIVGGKKIRINILFSFIYTLKIGFIGIATNGLEITNSSIKSINNTKNTIQAGSNVGGFLGKKKKKVNF